MRIAIQGELGSNSHMAAAQMLAGSKEPVELIACAFSAEAIAGVSSGQVDGAVLPIENSLHGSVVEHYDLLWSEPVRAIAEGLIRIQHNVIALPGVHMEEVTSVISHPVALAQCRRWQREHPAIAAMPFYDTAGSVKHLVAEGLRHTVAIAPELAARVYGGEILATGVEDHWENYTRFLWIVPETLAAERRSPDADKMSVGFAVEHRPGTLVQALEGLARVGADLTKIESRPVPGRPWEYTFYIDLRFTSQEIAEASLESLRLTASMVKELGRYREAKTV